LVRLRDTSLQRPDSPSELARKKKVARQFSQVVEGKPDPPLARLEVPITYVLIDELEKGGKTFSICS